MTNEAKFYLRQLRSKLQIQAEHCSKSLRISSSEEIRGTQYEAEHFIAAIDEALSENVDGCIHPLAAMAAMAAIGL